MKPALLGLALAAFFPLPAQAGDLSYSYVEATRQGWDWIDFGLQGHGVAGSVGFRNWYLAASYRRVDGDTTNDLLPIEVELDETTASLGWHHALNKRVDVFVEVGYDDAGVVFFAPVSDHGYHAALGMRALLRGRLEGNIKAKYTRFSDFGDGEYGAVVGAVWQLTPHWGVTGSYEWNKFINQKLHTWGLGIRATF